MAALGKIRKHGALLVIVIGLALFAFVAEEAFRSCESTKNQTRQQVAEVNGKKLSVQEYQSMIDEFTEVLKMTQGRENFNDEELTQIKDQVWQTFVQDNILRKEAEKLGLTVTDQELQNVISEGNNQMLMQTPFINQQTGRFDYAQLQKFIAEYKKMNRTANPQMTEQYDKIYNYWKFIEKTMRSQILNEKYQTLLAHCFLTNPISEKANFKNKNEESTIKLASFPFTSIQDKDVKITDADFEKKYNEMKEMFKQPVETRDIKYIAFQIKASAQDRAVIKADIDSTAKQLAAAADPTEAVRRANSLVPFLGVPVSEKAFPADIAEKIKTLGEGQTEPFENAADNTINIIKILSAQQPPDSIQFRAIQVAGATIDEARTRADSITTALNGGANFEELAKKYSQDGKEQWLTTAMYENAPSIDKDTKAYLTAINNAEINEIKNVEMTNGNVIIKVTDRKNFITKYNAAIVKRAYDFSKDTYSAAYNKFSQMVSASKDIESLKKNAQKFGYQMQNEDGITTANHTVANLKATREALKWIFDAKSGDISPLYECGNNDNLLVVALDKVHEKGYRPMKDVKEELRIFVINDKKAEMLMKKAEGIKDIASAQKKGAQISDLAQVTFNAPAFVAETGNVEPAISGAVAGTAKGKFVSHPVKGNAGVYLFQVIDKKQNAAKFNAKAEQQELKSRSMQAAGQYMNELYLKANVTDNRYLFF